jgi:hypothetical protein
MSADPRAPLPITTAMSGARQRVCQQATVNAPISQCPYRAYATHSSGEGGHSCSVARVTTQPLPTLATCVPDTQSHKPVSSVNEPTFGRVTARPSRRGPLTYSAHALSCQPPKFVPAKISHDDHALAVADNPIVLRSYIIVIRRDDWPQFGEQRQATHIECSTVYRGLDRDHTR